MNYNLFSQKEFTRRIFLLGSVSTAVIFQACNVNPEKTNRPNVLVILTDDLRADAIGISGNPHVKTPNIDKLGKDGVVYKNAFVTTSICPTSRASILTGEFASRHGLWKFGTYDDQLVQRSFLSILRKNGYYTSYIGKWGIGGPIPEDTFDFHYSFGNAKKYFSDEYEARGNDHLTEYIGNIAVDQIAKTPIRKPFCMVFSTKAPHVQDGDEWPFQPDPEFNEQYKEKEFPLAPSINKDSFEQLPSFLKESEGRIRWELRFGSPEKADKSRKDYYRLVSGIDQQVGRLVSELKSKNLYDNTLIIFTSDNGMMLGEHGLSGKWWMFEESIRIPMIVKTPENSPELPNQNKMVLNIDICPTILDSCGISPMASVQGQSMLVDNNRDKFFYEHLFEHPTIVKSEGLRTEKYKYVRYLLDGTFQESLFDLKVDPYELNDLTNDVSKLTILESLRVVFDQEKLKIRSI